MTSPQKGPSRETRDLIGVPRLGSWGTGARHRAQGGRDTGARGEDGGYAGGTPSREVLPRAARARGPQHGRLSAGQSLQLLQPRRLVRKALGNNCVDSMTKCPEVPVEE